MPITRKQARDGNIDIPPLAKKLKVDEVLYPCHSCLEDRNAKAFPDYNPSSECDHLINTCKTCLKQWVEAQIEGGNFRTSSDDGKVFGIVCPQCPALMRNVNIEIAATKRAYQMFVDIERRHIADAIPGWRWCMNPLCSAGQVYHPPVAPPHLASKGARTSKAKTSRIKESASAHKRSDDALDGPTAAIDIITCNACGAKACVPCNRPWHNGESCEAYQVRIRDRVAEEDASLVVIQRETKKCPGCQKNIQKNMGCNYMSCTQCHVNFCFACLHIFGTDGVYCKCYPNA